MIYYSYSKENFITRECAMCKTTLGSALNYYYQTSTLFYEI